MTRRLITVGLASSHRGTMAGLREQLADLPLEWIAGHQLLDSPSSTADADHSFADKALRKALLLADAAMVPAVGEASGLAVTALGGEPGVRSARFAGWGATDAENNAELLRRLLDVEAPGRQARFVCALALADPWGDAPVVVTASCEGHIAHKPGDTGGFGYAPLFIVDGFDKTFAQLHDDERRQVGHRHRAIAQLTPALRALVAGRLREAAL